MNRKFYICSTSEGCAVNLNESSSIANMLKVEGYQRCDTSDEASLIIVNTCAVNSDIEDKTAAFLTTLKQKYPHKKIVTTGCFPEINPDRFKTNFTMPFVSPKKLSDFNDILGIKKLDHQQVSNSFDPQHSGVSYHGRFEKIRTILKWKFVKSITPIKLTNLIKGVVFNNDFFILPIGTGCLGECTYCAIKYARGTAVSRSVESIMDNLKTANNKNVWVLAGDVGCWGQDIHSDISQLFSSLFGKGNLNIVVNYFGPEWLEKYYEKLIPYLHDPQLTYIGIPIQSGSNEVLESTKRYYKIEAIKNIIAKIKRGNPNLIIKTDVIIGLPGETWKDFLKTISAIWYFDTVYAQGYSKHSRTSAKKSDNQVPPFVIQLRSKLMKLVIILKHSATLISCFNPARIFRK